VNLAGSFEAHGGGSGSSTGGFMRMNVPQDYDNVIKGYKFNVSQDDFSFSWMSTAQVPRTMQSFSGGTGDYIFHSGLPDGSGSLTGPALNLQADHSALFYNTIYAVAGTADDASLNIAEGIAPTVPVDGDVWITAAGPSHYR
jgi:hypothetical protein